MVKPGTPRRRRAQVAKRRRKRKLPIPPRETTPADVQPPSPDARLDNVDPGSLGDGVDRPDLDSSPQSDLGQDPIFRPDLDPQFDPSVPQPDDDWWHFPGLADHAAVFEQLDSDVPVLFFPVRIETRFTEETADGRDLMIRLYPDQVNVDDHKHSLSASEVKIGRAYWDAWSAAESADDDAARETARVWLAKQLPPRRAAWVARQTQVKKGRPPTVDDDLRPPTAACLPERWALVGFTRDADDKLVQRFVVWTNRVREDITVGVDPDGIDTEKAAGVLPVDDGMRWMVEYDEAVAAGMAVTIDLKAYPDIADDGLAVLLAIGVSERNAAQGSAAVASLLRAHHYSHGLSFVPQGTPTNNTDQVDSPWSFREPDAAALFARELDGEDEAVALTSNGRRLGLALGDADNALLTRLEYANLDEETPQQAMNRVLWDVTWGQYFDKLLAGHESASALPSNARSDFRTRFLQDVRATPMPALRVGAQPYGVLPARFSSVPAQWADASPWFEYVLHYLREAWLDAAASSVPRIDPVLGATGGVAGNDPNSKLTELLSVLPHPKRFILRELHNWRETDQVSSDALGAIFGALLFPYLVLDDPTFGCEALSVLGRWGWGIGVLGGDDFLGLSAASMDPLDSTSLNSADAQIAALQDLRGRVNSLLLTGDDQDSARAWIDSLIRLVEQHRDRQTPLREIAAGSLDFHGIIADDVDDPTIFYSVYEQDDETFDFDLPLVHSDVASTGRYLDELRERVPQLFDEPGELGEVPEIGSLPGGISGSISRDVRADTALGMRRATRRLQPEILDDLDSFPTGLGLPMAFHDAEPLLYQLLDGVVDDIPLLEAGAYRATLESLATLPEETLELRFRETLGLASNRLDAYFTSMARRRLDALRANNSGIQLGGYGWVLDLKPDASRALDSQGFVHAPSLPQAATAAILRSGWSAHGTEEDNSAMAVDLGGGRVQLAAWLLDGVRQGQSLGELLGYRFERGLHDARLDAWIDPVRRATLLAAGVSRAPRGPVDGLNLLERWRDTGTVEKLLADVPSKYLPSSSSLALVAHLEGLEDALDAAGDAAIAESVHRVSEGNMTRAAATLDAINQGEVPPPQLLGLRTPVAGVGIVHRVIILLGHTEPANGWSGDTARAILDPALEAWVGAILGEASDVICRVSTTSGDAPPEDWQPVSMAMLNLCALDAVFEAPAGDLSGDSRWRRRIEAHVRESLTASQQADQVHIDFAPDAPGITMEDFAQSARAVRSVLGKSRALDARDLLAAQEEVAARQDIGGIESRAAALESTFRARATALLKLLPVDRATEQEPHPAGTASAGQLRTAMGQLVDYALIGVIPAHGWLETKEDTALLWSQAWRLGDKASKRLQALDALAAEIAKDQTQPASDAVRLQQAEARLSLIVGRAFPLVPRFTAVGTTQIKSGFSASDVLTNGDAPAIHSFLNQVGRVRPDVAAFNDMLQLSELLSNRAATSLRVAQNPYQPGDQWVATNLPEAGTGGRVHWVLADHGGLASLDAGAVSGLMVSEWTERIPSSTQTTGVAFHFDAPAARAPQSLLLAVTPDDEQTWGFELAVATLMQTLEDAQVRAVGPQDLGAYGHHLPAIFSPRRIHGAA